jgi:hypothetical protein
MFLEELIAQEISDVKNAKMERNILVLTIIEIFYLIYASS